MLLNNKDSQVSFYNVCQFFSLAANKQVYGHYDLTFFYFYPSIHIIQNLSIPYANSSLVNGCALYNE